MKMKLGDMEMDSDEGISFESDDPSPNGESNGASGTLQSKSSPNVLSKSWLRSTDLVRLPSYVFYATSIVALMVAVGAGWMVTASILPAVMLIGLLPLVAAAGGSAWVGYIVSGTSDGAQSQANRQFFERKILDVLEGQPEPLRLEEIAEARQLEEKEIVSSLADLVDSGKVDEDLDVDTGEWVYQLNASSDDELDQIERRSLPVHERKEALETNDG